MRGKIRDRILRIVANNSSGDISKYRIAKLADCSYPWVREFFLKLTKMGLVKDTTVLDFPGLLNYWQSYRIKNKYREYMLKDPLKTLKSTSLSYVLTTYQAENLVQNYLFPSRVDVYIRESDWSQWHDLLSKNGLVGKGNVRLLLSDEHVFYNSFEKDELKIVSIPQLIVDLMNEGGVCVEAADLLIKRMMKNV